MPLICLNIYEPGRHLKIHWFYLIKIWKFMSLSYGDESTIRVKWLTLPQKIKKCGAWGAVRSSEVHEVQWGAENRKWQKINFFIHWHDIYHCKAHDLWFKNLYLFLGLRVISASGARTWKWTWKRIFLLFSNYMFLESWDQA